MGWRCHWYTAPYGFAITRAIALSPRNLNDVSPGSSAMQHTPCTGRGAGGSAALNAARLLLVNGRRGWRSARVTPDGGDHRWERSGGGGGLFLGPRTARSGAGSLDQAPESTQGHCLTGAQGLPECGERHQKSLGNTHGWQTLCNNRDKR